MASSPAGGPENTTHDQRVHFMGKDHGSTAPPQTALSRAGRWVEQGNGPVRILQGEKVPGSTPPDELCPLQKAQGDSGSGSMAADPCDPLREFVPWVPTSFRLCVSRGPGSRCMCEHACMCVCECVCTHARVCVSTGDTVRVPLNSSAVACPSGPHASSAAGAERSSPSSSGESPVIMRSRDAAVSWGREVGTGHGEGVSVALGWSTECPVLAGNGRQQPRPEGTGDWGALQARLPALQIGKQGRATASVSEGLRVKCVVGPLVLPTPWSFPRGS